MAISTRLLHCPSAKRGMKHHINKITYKIYQSRQDLFSNLRDFPSFEFVQEITSVIDLEVNWSKSRNGLESKTGSKPRN